MIDLELCLTEPLPSSRAEGLLPTPASRHPPAASPQTMQTPARAHRQLEHA